LSYQKKLIETVIDAHKTGKSLADDPTFAEAAAPKKSPAPAATPEFTPGDAKDDLPF
jgi:hypothetical protein